MASAIVESLRKSGGAMTVTPVDSESSIEAAVLAKMAASGVALADCKRDRPARPHQRQVAEAVGASTDADLRIKGAGRVDRRGAERRSPMPRWVLPRRSRFHMTPSWRRR